MFFAIYWKNSEMVLKEIKKGESGKGLLIENDGFLSLECGKNRQIKEDIENGTMECPNPLIVDAVFQKFGIKNANGRIYPENILKREVEKYQQMIAERMALGECNHPAETTIDLGRITHNIVELHWEGSTLVGKLQINLTPGYCKFGICSSFGDTIANLLMNGFKIGVSSRGVGSVEKRFGEMVVGDDFEIVCWDVVATPSTPGAYIGTNPGELQQYVESKGSQKKKSKINEKLERVKEIL